MLRISNYNSRIPDDYVPEALYFIGLNKTEFRFLKMCLLNLYVFCTMKYCKYNKLLYCDILISIK